MDHRKSKKTNLNRKSLLFDNHLGHRGSSWNQFSELCLPMISTVDLGLIVGHRVFYKYPYWDCFSDLAYYEFSHIRVL